MIFEKLKELEKRYTELEKLLAIQEVISDRNKYQGYAKELSKLSKVVEKYRLFNKKEAELKDLEHILSEKHEESFLDLAKSEISKVKQDLADLTLEIESLLKGEEADKEQEVVIEIRAGTGGQEASLFAGDLYRMYTKYADKCGFKHDILSSHISEAGGFKQVIFSVFGMGAYKNLKYESGVHRVQRVPQTESSGRIHTSTVTVAVLIEPDEVELIINQQELKVDVYRSSGHGGQSVNTTDSAVRITHLPSGLVVTCQDERSQLKNKIKAMKVLRAKLLDKMRQDEANKLASDRKTQVGTGGRSEKIRTYNFPDRRITDHRIGLTIYKFEDVLEGRIDEFVSALQEREAGEKVRGE